MNSHMVEGDPSRPTRGKRKLLFLGPETTWKGPLEPVEGDFVQDPKTATALTAEYRDLKVGRQTTDGTLNEARVLLGRVRHRSSARNR